MNVVSYVIYLLYLKYGILNRDVNKNILKNAMHVIDKS